MARGVGPLDEFPIHQAPLPAAWSATTDRHFYDRNYFNAHGRTGDAFVIFGHGYYPNLGVKDAFVGVLRGEEVTTVHLSDTIDDDRLNQRIGAYRVEVATPLQQLRVVLEETEGIAMDLTWQGSFEALLELPHVMRAGSRVTLDAQRFAQVGTWEGVISVDGQDIEVAPDRWVGSRDRSWGIRPVGEPMPGGAPSDPPFDGMWWLYVPIRFDDFALVLIIQEDPDGYRILNDCSRVFADGRVEQLGWPQVQVHYASGTRFPSGASISCTTPAGKPVEIEVESLLGFPLHVGCGYGGDPDWNHGMWKGADFRERRTYDLSDPTVKDGPIPGVIVDHVARVTLTGPEGTSQGWGLFEHSVMGRHDPSGFSDWFVTAP